MNQAHRRIESFPVIILRNYVPLSNGFIPSTNQQNDKTRSFQYVVIMLPEYLGTSVEHYEL